MGRKGECEHRARDQPRGHADVRLQLLQGSIHHERADPFSGVGPQGRTRHDVQDAVLSLQYSVDLLFRRQMPDQAHGSVAEVAAQRRLVWAIGSRGEDEDVDLPCHELQPAEQLRDVWLLAVAQGVLDGDLEAPEQHP
ncbi:MAG: hypothetical protein H6734_17565 [Alphaproteobacteria bacterium]|nr:hypothetical protein [Alphaproteobacteria bacterium]